MDTELKTMFLRLTTHDACTLRLKFFDILHMHTGMELSKPVQRLTSSGFTNRKKVLLSHLQAFR
jgi:hypothetical protein